MVTNYEYVEEDERGYPRRVWVDSGGVDHILINDEWVPKENTHFNGIETVVNDDANY
jgi:hypothetical protein